MEELHDVGVLIKASLGAGVRGGTPLLKPVQQELRPHGNRAQAAAGGESADELVRDDAGQTFAAALHSEVIADAGRECPGVPSHQPIETPLRASIGG